jgi:hypothetical protein
VVVGDGDEGLAAALPPTVCLEETGVGEGRRARARSSWVPSRFSWSGPESWSRRGSLLLGGDGNGDGDGGGREWEAGPGWYKRGSAVIMGRRRGYTVIAGEEDGEGSNEEREKTEWWDIFLAGVGGISNLYVPVGDFCLLDLRVSSEARKRMGVILEDGIELVEI